MSQCCKDTRAPRAPSPVQAIRKLLAWIVPGSLLVLLPKCPACLAAHLAVWSGVGVSLATATRLRWLLLLGCACSLLFLILGRLARPEQFFRICKKETKSCDTPL